MALLIVGCTVVDLIFPEVAKLPAWPAHTEFTSANLVLLSAPPLVTIGGNGANAAFVAARCGAKVTLHDNLGADALGGLARAWLAGAKVRIASSRRSRRTAINVTAANSRLRRATLFYPGSPVALPASARGFSQVLVCGWPHPPLVPLARRLRSWRAQGVRTAFDAGPILGTAPTLTDLRSMLAALDLFLANEHELLAITGETRLTPALGRLRNVFRGDIVVKLGARGAKWLPAGKRVPLHLPGRPVRAVNTVGAGDTFNGALLAALERRASFPAALRFANSAAASVVRSPRGVLGLRPPAFART